MFSQRCSLMGTNKPFLLSCLISNYTSSVDPKYYFAMFYMLIRKIILQSCMCWLEELSWVFKKRRIILSLYSVATIGHTYINMLLKRTSRFRREYVWAVQWFVSLNVVNGVIKFSFMGKNLMYEMWCPLFFAHECFLALLLSDIFLWSSIKAYNTYSGI
jgi:hypothetical protein